MGVEMDNYTGGIWYDPAMNTEELDHAIVVIGWGVEDGVKYWIAQNSWGTFFGEKGTIRIAKGSNMAGI